MDNQHRVIKGYRELNQHDLDRMNELKQIEQTVSNLIAVILADSDTDTDAARVARWAAIARTHLETGFMYAIKAVARPSLP